MRQQQMVVAGTVTYFTPKDVSADKTPKRTLRTPPPVSVHGVPFVPLPPLLLLLLLDLPPLTKFSFCSLHVYGKKQFFVKCVRTIRIEIERALQLYECFDSDQFFAFVKAFSAETALNAIDNLHEIEEVIDVAKDVFAGRETSYGYNSFGPVQADCHGKCLSPLSEPLSPVSFYSVLLTMKLVN